MPTGDFFEVASVYNPNLCRVLFVDFVASNKSPVFFFGENLCQGSSPSDRIDLAIRPKSWHLATFCCSGHIHL